MAEYIDRQAALASIKTLFPDMPKIDFMDNRSRWREVYSQYLNAEEVIRQVPSADVEPVRHGRWMEIVEANEQGEPYQAGVLCSECREAFVFEPNYCPNCGARMDEAGE